MSGEDEKHTQTVKALNVCGVCAGSRREENDIVTQCRVFFFIWCRLAMAHNNIASSFNCRVLAVKSNASSSPDSSSIPNSSTNMDFSQIDLAGLQ